MMKILESLKKAINETDEGILSDKFHVVSEKSNISFDGNMNYTGDSKIALELSVSMPTVIKHYLSDTSFESISEDQFNKALEKVQNALKEVADNFEQSLTTKLASYGLKEGEE